MSVCNIYILCVCACVCICGYGYLCVCIYVWNVKDSVHVCNGGGRMDGRASTGFLMFYVFKHSQSKRKMLVLNLGGV